MNCISLIYRHVIYGFPVAVVVGATIAFESEVTTLCPIIHFIKIQGKFIKSKILGFRLG